MRVLIDTQALIWFLLGDSKLSKNALDVISNPSAQRFVSVASLWEVALKMNVGKLDLGLNFEDFVINHVEVTTFDILQIERHHLAAYVNLPLHHRDLFDRLLVTQAQTERLRIVSSNPHLQQYGVDVIW